MTRAVRARFRDVSGFLSVVVCALRFGVRQRMGSIRNMEWRFNDALDDKLIACVRNHPVLYQPNRDIRSKQQAWKKIAPEIGRTVTECKTRWRTIRDSYKKKKDKMESQVLFGFEAPAITNKYYNGCLSFLDGTFTDRGNRQNKYIEQLKQLSNTKQLLLTDDLCREDKSTRDKSKTTSGNTEVKIEVVTEDDFSRENEQSCCATTPMSPEPRVNTSIEQDSESHVSVYEVESDIEVIATRDNRLTDSSDRNVSAIRTKLSSETVSDSGAGNRKRALNSDNRMTPEDAKRRDRNVVSGELPLREANSLPAVQPRDNVSEHPIQTFFRSMATTVMSFPPRLMAETRMEICKIVTDAELRFLSAQSDESVEPQTNSSLSAISGNLFPLIVKLSNSSQSHQLSSL